MRWYVPLLLLSGCTVLASCTMSPATIGEWSYVVSTALGVVAGMLGAKVRHLDVCDRCLRKQASGARKRGPRKPKSEAQRDVLPLR